MGGSRGNRPRQRAAPGVAPGTLVRDPHAHHSEFAVFAYGPEHLEELHVRDLDELVASRADVPVVWVDVDGVGDVDALQLMGDDFGLHPLALEDVVSLGQRPKFEAYAQQLFLVLQMPRADSVATEQLSLFLGAGFVITVQEQPGDPFELVRERLRSGRPRIRGAGSDYLAYALIDAVVDAYFPVIDACAQRLEELEEELDGADPESLARRILGVRRELLAVRRAVSPLRDVIGSLMRDDSGFVSDETRLYLRDCQDHTLRIVEMVETQRELAAGLRDMHLSLVSHRMNEIMKVLTIISTIFIPATFVAGVYGMNFDASASRFNMPELSWAFGYPVALLLMGAMALAMLLFFRRRGWLGGRQPGPTAGERR